ncbi:glycerol-3-phosphate responsive antiterminator [Shouchella clausii]|uniref:Glycerol uptake operon antiterminator regulatory protein n=1 Tax=Shouchella clausii TaxID=79880 RepID=A0A268S8J5_SHOCL|nr:glycerol-3-phosphate responsive antiterminator [Shouchella clausii]PAD42728.1 glycerol-3-phosphate responsive antiterminator GlpP [Bacillus sp. 7520-S]MBU8597919.1 glycerol-3-phosphate responsive antiterminator [Shouchella clausii]MCY1104968.1 glycerol-3-phosphate responsive antiterminator [Shouchella clausii]MEB5481582.1 glycerol-3-phosphate responsive antiterminator [Shouchella clausii]MED4158145.1 glycerol-3-phosphate responsive antiterminator [Shouchella clausii]
MFGGQTILPAIKTMKDFEVIMNSSHEYFVVLDLHLSKLASVKKRAREGNKKPILHADLIQGLKSDKAAAEFLCQVIRPAGLISTRGDMLRIAKKNGILAIQRVFLLDTLALETSYHLAETVKPDVIELLPGILPDYIGRVHRKTGIPVIAGGLIETMEDAKQAIKAGAQAVTASHQELWL